MWTRYISYVGRAAGLLLVCLLPCTNRASANTLPTRPGIWCELTKAGAVSKEHQQRLVTSLVRITGLCDLGFASDGELLFGDIQHVSGGAAAARQVLVSVLSSRNAFVIEDCSKSDSVNFGQISEDTILEDAERSRLDIWRVRIDFSDFRRVQAPLEVRASFDEGFILLHELLHGLGHTDATREGEIGECEEMVNRARDELGLPLRDQYFVAPIRVTDTLATARIRFRSRPRSPAEGFEWQYLYFLLKPASRYASGVRSATERR